MSLWSTALLKMLVFCQILRKNLTLPHVVNQLFADSITGGVLLMSVDE